MLAAVLGIRVVGISVSLDDIQSPVKMCNEIEYQKAQLVTCINNTHMQSVCLVKVNNA